MVDFGITIDRLRQENLIGEGEIVIVAMQRPSQTAAYMFGAIGAAIAASKCDYYILAMSENGFKVFDIDKNNGEYMGTVSNIAMSELRSLRGSLGGIYLQTADGRLDFSTAKAMKGFKQKEEYKRAFEFLKANKR